MRSWIVCLVLAAAFSAVAGQERTPNVTDAKGKQGRWTEYLDDRLLPVLHDSNATVIRTLSYKDGVPCDTLREFYRDGHLLRIGVVVGRKDEVMTFTGVGTSYFENGKVKEIATWTDGVLSGSYTTYYETGEERLRGYYFDGERDGMWTALGQDGSVKTRGRFESGLRDGVWIYEKPGQGPDSVWYVNGSPVDALGFIQLAKKAVLDHLPDRARYFVAKAEQLDPSFSDTASKNWIWAQAVLVTADHEDDNELLASLGLDRLMSAVRRHSGSDPQLLARLSSAWKKSWSILGFYEAVRSVSDEAVLASFQEGMEIGAVRLVQLSTEISRSCLWSRDAEHIDSLDKQLVLVRNAHHVHNDDDSLADRFANLVGLGLRARKLKLEDELDSTSAINDTVVNAVQELCKDLDNYESEGLTQIYMHLNWVGGLSQVQTEQILSAARAVDSTDNSLWWSMHLSVLRSRARAGDHTWVVQEACRTLEQDLSKEHPLRDRYTYVAMSSAMYIDNCDLIVCIVKHAIDLYSDDEHGEISQEELTQLIESCEEFIDPELRRYKEEIKRM